MFPSFLLLSTTSRPRHQGSSRFHLSKCDQSCHQDSAWSVLRSFPWWIYQQIKHQLETDPSCLKMIGTQAKSSCFIIIWWYTYPSEKYESQMGLLFPIYGKSYNMFQTTNQFIIIYQFSVSYWIRNCEVDPPGSDAPTWLDGNMKWEIPRLIGKNNHAFR